MIRIALFVLAAATGSTSAAAAERNFTVTTFDRVRVDGPFAVTLTTGRSPTAKASGSSRALDGVSVEVQGRTLIVRPNRAAWGGYPGESAGAVQIAVSTHELAEVNVNGSGSLEINRVKAFEFDGSVQGSGSLVIADAAVDRLSAGVSGSGSVRIAGKALKASASVRGPSGFDGSGLLVKDAVVSAAGPSTVKLNASNSAKVTAAGMARVELAGNPACTVKTSGSATVSGCR